QPLVPDVDLMRSRSDVENANLDDGWPAFCSAPGWTAALVPCVSGVGVSVCVDFPHAPSASIAASAPPRRMPPADRRVDSAMRWRQVWKTVSVVFTSLSLRPGVSASRWVYRGRVGDPSSPGVRRRERGEGAHQSSLSAADSSAGEERAV